MHNFAAKPKTKAIAPHTTKKTQNNLSAVKREDRIFNSDGKKCCRGPLFIP
jgi:hypothetical protein